MGYNTKENKFVSYLIILFSLFILFLITFNQYEKMQINLDESQILESDIDIKREKLEKYALMREEAKKDQNNLDKYILDIKEDELINYIYSYIEEVNTSENTIGIKGLDISKGDKNELGFNETNIKLALVVSNENSLKMILGFLSGENSKYNFIIESFTYPKDGRTGSFEVEIPLKIFYK